MQPWARLASSWVASGESYEARLQQGLQPRWDLELGLPPSLGFLDPSNLQAIVAANAAYLFAVAVIVAWVKRSGPVSDTLLRPFMLFYNITCVVLAGAVVFGIARYKLNTRLGSFACNPPDFSPEGKELSWFIWLYYAQKYWEYLDTLIFAMRGSFRQLTFLHLYHHVSITLVTAAFLRPGSAASASLRSPTRCR